MSGATVSVVVVSRDRPALLCRCLRGLAQLDHPAFEVVVVADAAGLAALASAGLDRGVKSARQDAANISAARNAGTALAAGDIVAFLDDDAVPEPSWLSHLARAFRAFDEPEVAAAGGFVRGRNGISYQWRGRMLTADGDETGIPPWGTAPRVFAAEPGRAVKLQGTNMAVRRSVLAGLGGFDPAFRYFLDDADLSLRLAAAGHRVALVPLAEVHHGFAASPRRRADRAPLDLFEIGASQAVFLRKHGDAGEAGLAGAAHTERLRLIAQMVTGRIEPRDVDRLIAGYRAGLAEGRARPLASLPPLAGATAPFRPAAGSRVPMQRLAGRVWQARRLRAEAAALVAAGVPVTLFLFSPSARPHWLGFTEGGWWEQRGGLFGRTERRGPPLRLTGFRGRLARETARLAPLRVFAAPQ